MTLERKDIRRFRVAIRILEREIARGLRSQTVHCGVTTAQCHLLMELDQHQPQTVNELALALGLDKSTLSRTLDGMAELALVNRAEDPGDRRALCITLTVKGRETVKRINQLCDGVYRRLLERIPELKRQGVLEAIEILSGAMKTTRDQRVRAASVRCSV